MKIKRAEKKPRESLRIQEQSLKVKSYTIKQAGLAGAKSASEQVEGGRELQNAALVEYMLAKPVVKGTAKSAHFLKKKSQEVKNKQDKRKEREREKESSRNSAECRDTRNTHGEHSNKKSTKSQNAENPKSGKRKHGMKKLMQQMKFV